MYLIDSSLWIDYFRPKGSSAVKSRVRQVLQDDEALTCGIVIVEVLRGARTEAEYSTLEESITSLPQIPFDHEIFKRAAQWAYQLDRKGRIISTTDLLIASASFGKALLLHNDKDFETIAAHVHINEERISAK
jgi:predicted nucleic acid-binding protein